MTNGGLRESKGEGEITKREQREREKSKRKQKEREKSERERERERERGGRQLREKKNNFFFLQIFYNSQILQDRLLGGFRT